MATDHIGETEPSFEFDSEGHLTVSFGLYHEGWREPSCCECHKPVRWVLDMVSFKTNGRGGYDLGHAACLWTPGGFDREKAKASLPGRSERAGS